MVVAVVVCYHPDLVRLRETCDRLLASGATIVLVDNSEPGAGLPNRVDFADCITIVNGDNFGIARAQNVGIARAIAEGARIVVFLDQDSKISDGFVSTLLAPVVPGRAMVVAPVYYDEAKGFEYPSLRLNRLRLLRPAYAGDRLEPYPVDAVISSGTAATVEVFEQAGVMDEDFFIDWVDTEWCLRCRRRGVPIMIVPRATMRHTMGTRSISLGVFTVLVYGPLRSYYQVRNCFHLFGKESIPPLLAVRELLVLTIHKLVVLFVVPKKAEYLKALADAVADGLRGVTGKKPLPSPRAGHRVRA
jgi:rhamnosyltransferase